jgi:hypothetical protein
MQTLVADAVQPACDQLTALLPDQAHLSIDESPTKQKNSKVWLWTFVAQSFTVFAVRTSRAATILDDLLTKRFVGIVTCDRAKMYWQCGRLQWCWAHLKRDFQALIDHPDRRVRRLGHDLMRPTKRLFGVWARYRDGTIDRRRFQREMQPIRQEIEGLLLRGAFSGSRRLRGMCKELYDHREWLWAFVEHAGIEPTNNASERALRHGVIWRKLSFGTQSVAGSRFVSNLLTAIETCRQQDRAVFEYLTAAVAAHFDVPRHWWFSAWRWQSAARPVFPIGKRKEYLPPFGRDLIRYCYPTRRVRYTAPMDSAGVYKAMGTAGDRPDIGLVTEWQAEYLLTGKDDAQRSLLNKSTQKGKWTRLVSLR